MPFASNGTYTAASGATTAFSGETIASATWNAIFTDMQSAFTTVGQAGSKTFKGNSTGSSATVADMTVAQAQALIASPYIIITAIGVNFNSVADTAFAFSLPTGFTRFKFINVTLSHASHDISTATMDVRTASGGGGSSFPSSGVITVTATADATQNNSQTTGQDSLAATTTFLAASLATPNTIYFRVTNAEGTAATADVQIILQVVP